MEKTGSRMGYEYKYRFWWTIIERFRLSCPRDDNIKFVFERRSYFVVKRNDGGGGDEIVDSETFELVLRHERLGAYGLSEFWCIRLGEDYWMSGDEVDELVRKACAFARQKQKELADDDSLPFIPIAVELDVCTVQKAGEPISDVYGRALRSQHMYPKILRKFDNREVGGDFLGYPFDDYEYEEFVMSGGGLQVDRVEDVERTLEYWMVGLGNEEAAAANLEQIVCRLCAHKPVIGDEIALLLSCCHRFHHHCIVEWLLKYEKTCPTCRRHITYVE